MTYTEKNLQDQVDQLTQEVELLRKQNEQSKAAYDQLLFQMKEMMRHRFGQRSARFEDPDNPQASLFGDDAEIEGTDADNGETDNVVDITSYRRRKKNTRQFADHLPRKEVVIPVAEHELACDCGYQKHVISHEKHERLNYIPPVYEAIVELREKVACPKGCQGHIKVAPKPRHILPKASITESTLAHIIVSKLDDRQPYYHLEKPFEKRASFTLSRQTMARSVIESARTSIDDGPGVDQENIEEIGSRSVRLNHEITGHGLGLSIVIDIVDRYQGMINFSNNRFGGFSVEVELPKNAHINND